MNRKREYDTERVKEKENAKKGRERGRPAAQGREREGVWMRRGWL